MQEGIVVPSAPKGRISLRVFPGWGFPLLGFKV